MAKDPAFLFYPGDWILGTMGMTFEEKGAYMELLMMQFNRGAFTDSMACMCIRSDELWASVKFKFKYKDGFYWNDRLSEEQEKRKAYTESRRKSRLKSDEDNVRIYIVRDNVRSTYKIGSSVNPVRRYNELNNQKSPAIMGDSDPKDRDITLIWYSDPVLRSEESKLHKHFSDSNISGEWFNLTEPDLKYIYNKYNGTFKERTNQRTENVNVNEDRDINKDKTVYRSFVHLSITIAQCKKLTTFGYNKRQIDNILDSIENYEGNKKYKSLYLTAKKWLEKEEKKTATSRDPKSEAAPEGYGEISETAITLEQYKAQKDKT